MRRAILRVVVIGGTVRKYSRVGFGMEGVRQSDVGGRCGFWLGGFLRRCCLHVARRVSGRGQALRGLRVNTSACPT